MSNTVDSRVVEMKFDNKKFESNVKTTMSTLEKLKSSLNFKGIDSNFKSISKAADKVDMSGLSGAIETVQTKFSALDIIAKRFLENLTDNAYRAGKNLVESLSIDQISAGWEKYGSVTTSTATLLGQGYGVEEVENVMERLNWFTDETSYNLTEMVNNIGKFTATGVKLSEAEEAMEGIALWAALSGQNATTASRAMYQLSQAMGAGVMRREDYRSIQNASMDTQEFRQKALDAAVALGTLQKNADDTYESLLNYQGTFTIDQFANHLTEDAWFTKEVMMKVFEDYAAGVDQLYSYTIENNVTASEAIKEIGNEVDEFGLKAFKAGQQARTWTDALNSVKDAVSTGWMNTFKLIFGNTEEATNLWTDLANAMYDIFAEGGNERNAMLAEWSELGGRESLLVSFWELWENLVSVVNTFGTAFRNAFPKKTAKDLKDITDSFSEFISNAKIGEETFSRLENIFGGMFSSLKIIKNSIVALLKPIAKALKLGDNLQEIGDKLFGATSGLGAFIQELDRTNKISDAFGRAGEFIAGMILKLVDAIKKLIPIAKDGYQIAKNFILGLAEGFGNGIRTVIQWAKNIGRKIIETVKDVLGIHSPSKEAYEIGKNFMIGLVNGIKSFVGKVVDISKKVAKTVGDSFAKFLSREDVQIVLNAFKTVGKAIYNTGIFIGKYLIIGIKKIFNNPKASFETGKNFIIGLVKGIKSFIKKVADVSKKVAKTISDSFKKFFGREDVKIIVGSFKTVGTLIYDTGILIGERLIAGIKKIFNKSNVSSEFAQDGISVDDMVADPEQSNVASFIDKLKDAMTELKDFCVTAWETVIRPIFMTIGALGKSVLDSIGFNSDTFKEAFASGDINEVFDAFNSLDLTKITEQVKNLAGAFAFIELIKLMSSLSSEADAITDVTSGLAKSLKAISRNLNFKSILFIAKGLLAIAGALFIISLIPEDRLWSSVGAFATLAGILAGIYTGMAVLNKFDIAGGFFSGSGILSFSLGLLAFAGALKIISLLDPKEINDTVLELKNVFITIGALVIASKLGSGNLRGFLSLALGLLVLVGAVKLLGGMTKEEIEDGTDKLWLFMGIIAAFTIILGVAGRLAGKNKLASSILALVLGFAVIVYLLKTTIGEFGDDMDKVTATLIIFGEIMGALLGALLVGAIIARIGGKGFSKMSSIIFAIVAVIGLVILLSQLINDNYAAIEKSMATIGIIIGGLTLSIIGIGVATKLMKGSLGSSLAAMIMFAILISEIVAALEIMMEIEDPKKLNSAMISLGEIVGGLVVALLGLGLATKLMKNMGATLAAMIMFTTLIAVIIGAIWLLGSEMSPKQVSSALNSLLKIGIGLMAALLILGGITNLMTNMGATLAAMIMFTVIIGVIVGAIYLLDQMAQNGGDPGGAMVLLAAGMVALALALAIMGTACEASALGLAAAALVLIAFGAAVWLVAEGVRIMCESILMLSLFAGPLQNLALVLAELALGLGAFALAIAAFAVAGLIAAPVLLLFSAALVVFAGALAVFAKAMALMGESTLVVANCVDTVVDIFTGLLDKVKKALGIASPSKKFSEIGRFMMEGFVNGIKETWNKLKDGVTNIFSGVVSSVKNLFGIKSPSRVFKQIGRYVDEGFAIGVETYADTVSAATEDMAKQAIDGAKDGLNTDSDLISQLFDGSDPVIRPILDLSDIEAGSRMISGLFNRNQALALTSDANFGNYSGGQSSGVVINMTINGAQGQNVRELADLVSSRLADSMKRSERIWK